MSTIAVDNARPSAGGTAYSLTDGVAKATCSYDQVAVEIDESSNVSSVTDVATGQSTVNLTNSMNVADAAVVGSAFSVQNWAVAQASGSYNFNTRSASSVFTDSSGVYTARFGDLA